MQGRSWMAALTMGSALAASLAPTPSRAADPAPIKQKVTLNLWLTGLAGQKAEVVVKPGHPACRFKPITRAIDPNVAVAFGPIDVETYSADGNCSFAITIKEPGHPDKTVRRNLQLTPSPPPAPGAKPEPPLTLTCYVSSRSVGVKSASPAAMVAEKAPPADKPAEAKRKD